MDAVRLYTRYAGVSIRGQMQYRASFIVRSAGLRLASLAEFGGLVALFARFESLRGWTLPEVAILYGMVNTVFAFAETAARGLDVLAALVKSSDFDQPLLRPRSTAVQVAGQELQLMRVGRLAQGVGVLAWGAAHASTICSPAALLLMGACIMGGASLFPSLFVLQATMALWTIESLEIVNTVTYGGTETAQYPLTIYRPWFRRFFTFAVPLASINIVPASVLFARPELAGAPMAAAWFSPLVGVAFPLLALRAWDFGARHYRSMGS